MGNVKLVRIGIGLDQRQAAHFRQAEPAGTSNSGSFNMYVTPEERRFLKRLCGAIQNSGNDSLLIVQDLEEQSA